MFSLSGRTEDSLVYGPAYYDRIGAPPSASLGDLLANAFAIFSGRIAEILPGFYRGDAVSLLRLKVTRDLAAPTGEPTRDEVFIPYPYADFQLGELRIHKAEPAFRYRPSVGDRLIFFAYWQSGADDRLLAPHDPQHYIFETSTGRVFVPDRLRPAPAIGQLAALESIESALVEQMKRIGRRSAKRED